MPGIELREQERRTLRLSAPRWPFSPAAGSMLPGSPLAASCPEPVARNGFSLARNSCRLSATSIPGSKLSACYFAPFQAGFRARSALRLRHRVPVCARLRRFHCLWPVAFPPLGSACRACDLHSPPGFLPPSGSKRSTAFAACRSAWRIRPISLRSPPPLSIASVSASDHRSGSATFPEACCSSNLLEPPSL